MSGRRPQCLPVLVTDHHDVTAEIVAGQSSPESRLKLEERNQVRCDAKAVGQVHTIGPATAKFQGKNAPADSMERAPSKSNSACRSGSEISTSCSLSGKGRGRSNSASTTVKSVL